MADLSELKSIEVDCPNTFCLGNLVFFLLVEEYERSIERHGDYRRPMAALYVPTMVEYVVVAGIGLTEEPRPWEGELRLFPTYRQTGEAGSPEALGQALRDVVRDRPDDLFGILVNPHELIGLICLMWEIEMPELVIDRSPEEAAELVEASEEDAGDELEGEDEGGQGATTTRPRRRPQPPTTNRPPFGRKGR